jgi:epoxyqueuosine reductase
MNSKSKTHVIDSTNKLKSFIRNLGIDLVGVASLSGMDNMPVGLDINLSDFFKKYPYAIFIGAQYGKISRNTSSGTDTAIYLEKTAYDIMEYLEKKHYQSLVIHTEDEYDPDNRRGLLSLKVLAKQAGLGWQGRSLLIISPIYGPIHRLIAILTNMPLTSDEPLKNKCKDCVTCIDKCPKKSLTFCQFDDHPDSREEVLDVQTCLGDNGCMVCILKCPYLNKDI